MSNTPRQTGISMRGRRSSRVEIRLMVLVLVSTLLALAPALAGPGQAGELEIAGGVTPAGSGLTVGALGGEQTAVESGGGRR